MLKTILEPTSSYNVYIDIKDTRGQDKVDRLQEYLRNSKYDLIEALSRRFSRFGLTRLNL